MQKKIEQMREIIRIWEYRKQIDEGVIDSRKRKHKYL